MIIEIVVSTEGNTTTGFRPYVSIKRNGRVANAWRLMRVDDEDEAYEQAKKKAQELFPDAFKQLD